MKNCSLLVLLSTLATTAPAATTLDIYWNDVEGGGGTLIVTPGLSLRHGVVIDTGWPQSSSAPRIYSAATNAGLKKIDFLITTHFHTDHFGGAADLAKLIPIGTVLDNGIPDHDPDGSADSSRFLRMIQPYREFQAEKREIVEPGSLFGFDIPLAGAAKLTI